MDCLCVVAPKDEDLLRYALDGEALSPTAKEHLADCAICQQRLNRYATANDFLLTHLYRYQCPDMTTLSQYCVGMLSAHEEEKIRAHVRACPLCAVNVAETHSFLASPVPFVEPNLLSSSLPAQQDNISELANWCSPVALQPPASRIRVWPYFHQTDTVTLSLQAKQDYQDSIVLTGSLFSKNGGDGCSVFAGIKVELYRAMPPSSMEENIGEYAVHIEQLPTYMDQPLFSAQVDDQGTIVFGAVPGGEYLMIIYLPETALVIERLHIEVR
ncbi:hypothetical protein [Dictyobacter formicarum]|uniref:Zinc-finger domain-containing protein n=1 Tax=Dictyobacter formicarum TaxID=2778368 RepID=A0ABQ3VNS7_9CHLR|nr:hypothetical protein [Dictyobacter formicarum]GHO87899.1 hypothetical protein KSZ_59050 [Dictyobacter formicarum]